MDYKTGGVYLEALLQTVAYGRALVSMGVVDHIDSMDFVLVHIPRTVDDKLVEYTVKGDDGWLSIVMEAFFACQALRRVEKKVKLVEVEWRNPQPLTSTR